MPTVLVLSKQPDIQFHKSLHTYNGKIGNRKIKEFEFAIDVVCWIDLNNFASIWRLKIIGFVYV